MSAINNFFEPVSFRPDEQARQTHYEHSCVKQLLKWGGLTPSAFERERRQENPANWEFTLEWFNNQFPVFPVTLGSQKIDYIHEMNVVEDMFHRPTKTRLVKAYGEWLDLAGLAPETDHVGFLFELTGTGMGTQIFHNYPRLFPHPAPEGLGKHVMIGRYLGTPAVFHYLEPLKAFLFGIGQQWAKDYQGD